MELAFEEVAWESMFNVLRQYILNYSLVFRFGIPTIDKNMVEVPYTYFFVVSDSMHHFLK